jgi:hypothetical protein
MACEYHPRLVCEIASRDVEIPLKFHFVGPAGRGLGGTKEMPRLTRRRRSAPELTCRHRGFMVEE